MIVDCHTHWHTNWSGCDSTDPSRWLAILDLNEVQYAIVVPTRGLKDDRLLEIDNTEVVAASRRSNGRMIPFCTVNVWQNEKALVELDRCLNDLCCKGIKFHPWNQAFPVNHVLMDAICERAAAADVPILFHDGTPPYSLPSQIALLARRHPAVKMILGHCGLLEFWQEAITMLRACDNLWGCLCSPHPGAIREIVRCAPRERLCWGSDFGASTAGFADLVKYRLSLLKAARLTDSDSLQIFTENPRRLLKLPD